MAKRTPKCNANTKNARMAAAVEAIRKRLRLETLGTRGRDALDFHDVSVAAIRDVIQIAFDAGWDAGFEAATVLNK